MMIILTSNTSGVLLVTYCNIDGTSSDGKFTDVPVTVGQMAGIITRIVFGRHSS